MNLDGGEEDGRQWWFRAEVDANARWVSSPATKEGGSVQEDAPCKGMFERSDGSKHDEQTLQQRKANRECAYAAVVVACVGVGAGHS